MLRRLLRPRNLLILVAALLVVVGGLVAAVASGLLLHDTAVPLSAKEAVAAFRVERPSPAAGEGVYLYRTTGAESIDALGGAHHTYPVTSTVTLLLSGCGTELRWATLEHRSTTWLLCRVPGGISPRRTDEAHAFFGTTDTTTYTCGAGAVWPTAGTPGATSTYSCPSGSGGEDAVATFVGHESVDVGGRSVDGLKVRVVAKISGQNHGTESAEYVIDPDTLIPLRVVQQSRTGRDITLLLKANYREDATLHLTALTPLR